MALLAPTTVYKDGTLPASKYNGIPTRLLFTTGSTSDTYVHPVGVVAWACIPGLIDTFSVAYTGSTRTFTFTSAAGGDMITLLIWSSK